MSVLLYYQVGRKKCINFTILILFTKNTWNSQDHSFIELKMWFVRNKFSYNDIILVIFFYNKTFV